MENNEESVIVKIALDILTYQQDHTQTIITNELIKGIVEESIDEIVEEVRKVIGEFQ